MTPETQRFVRFVLTGGTAAGVNVLSRWVLSLVLVYEVAVAVAYLIGMLAAWVLARIFVFERSSQSAAGELGRFAIVNAFSFAFVWLVSVGLARLVFPAIGFTWNAETVAHIIGVLSPVVPSYLGHKHFTFVRSAG